MLWAIRLLQEGGSDIHPDEARIAQFVLLLLWGVTLLEKIMEIQRWVNYP